MKEEVTNKWNGIEILIVGVIGLVLLSNLWNSIDSRIDGFFARSQPASQEKGQFGALKTEIAAYSLKTRASLPAAVGGFGGQASANLAVGAQIVTSRVTALYDAPAGKLIDALPANIRGVIIGGPENGGGVRWFKVRYDDGVSGWVAEDSLLSEKAREIREVAAAIEPHGPITTAFSTLRFVATFFSLILLVGILYAAIRIFQLRSKQEQVLHQHATFFGESVPSMAEPIVGVPGNLPTEPMGRIRWRTIEKHVNSESESDWRLAVLEADILLDELSRLQGWRGENLGERLKGVDRSDFRTLDKAWEAHKMRNTLAHEGVNFPLSEREARRIIGLFKEVFQEFEYI